MRSTFTGDSPPPEPPARLDPDQARYWSVVAEQWHPDDEVRDHLLAGMLARADQTTVHPALRERMLTEAQRVLTEHRPDGQGNCSTCTDRWEGRHPIPYPCWAVQLAHLVTGHTSSATAPDEEGNRSVTATFHVDVLLILERDGCVLLAERSATGYADGWFNLPSGKLEAGEDVVTGMIREAREEIGIQLEPADLRVVQVMQHRSPEGQIRVGWFLAAERWDGEPYNAEPHKCARLLWTPIEDIPAKTWPYSAAGLAQYRAGTPYCLHGFSDETVPV